LYTKRRSSINCRWSNDLVRFRRQLIDTRKEKKPPLRTFFRKTRVPPTRARERAKIAIINNVNNKIIVVFVRTWRHHVLTRVASSRAYNNSDTFDQLPVGYAARYRRIVPAPSHQATRFDRTEIALKNYSVLLQITSWTYAAPVSFVQIFLKRLPVVSET